jgi:hypothetical protein
MNNTGLICNFPTIETIIDKLTKSKIRFVSYELVFSDILLQKKNSDHSVLLVFDKITKIIFIVDSNGTLNYFESHNPDFQLTFNSALSYYASFINFTYITMYDLDLSINFNKKIKSESQKSFFNGYCRAWTLLFQIILSNAPDDFDFIMYLKEISTYNLNLLNELIEIFQVFIYNKFIA